MHILIAGRNGGITRRLVRLKDAGETIYSSILSFILIKSLRWTNLKTQLENNLHYKLKFIFFFIVAVAAIPVIVDRGDWIKSIVQPIYIGRLMFVNKCMFNMETFDMYVDLWNASEMWRLLQVKHLATKCICTNGKMAFTCLNTTLWNAISWNIREAQCSDSLVNLLII